MISAVVLGGSLNRGPLRESGQVEYEALLPMGSKVMVEYVVDALLHAKKVKQIVVVGPRTELQARLQDPRVIVADVVGDVMENLEAGLKLLPGSERVLVVTSDVPLLTASAVDSFIDLCGDMTKDIYYPVIPKSAVEKRFANTKRTYVKLREGIFTGGNVFLLNPAVFNKCVPVGRKIFDLRKSPLGLCHVIGILFLLKYMLGLLALEDVREKASNLFNVRGEVVVSQSPEIGLDVDKPGDLMLVKSFLGV
ncbi:MAG: nucleotidyltransferase family protein [Peptococcaceae bacterium]|nr:nucleotidyltransferase family protein [Peptococcaceae bacterium]